MEFLSFLVFLFKLFDILQSFHFFLLGLFFCGGETPTTAVVEKKGPPQPEPEVEKVGKSVVEGEKKATAEVSNKVDDLIDPKKKALDEFKHLIQEALNKHEFIAPPPPPPPAKEKEKKEEEESKKRQQSRNPKSQ
ncbi:patellin-3-like [Forsythia ovata]|uniref:Patellin-3-like n=1 Tax=Forsythia ovata TaxID=205694 RepID=A0ABD1U7I8_9LAMI